MMMTATIDPGTHDMLLAIPPEELSETLPSILAAVTACMTGAMGPSKTADILRDWADRIEQARPVGHA
jgi:hypothetical protein